MDTPVIRIAGPGDAPALATLRRAWTEENNGPADDAGFEARFLDWYAREAPRRVSWVAEAGGGMIGMINMALFERMPQPGHGVATWGYLANAFVLAAHRDRGTGSQLLQALLGYADDQRFVRVVLSPSERSVPFYQRAGFTAEHDLLVRHLPE